MKLLFASDSFKGSLSSQETAEILARAAKEVFGDVTWSSVASLAGASKKTMDEIARKLDTERIKTIDLEL